ncbi:hypothetical protein BBF96_13120 [Anoxybacter fermentans]|uniref:Peptidase U32 n=1 Tax=Anoxybacter fermentans TaxID=1323375 RepID=A0A3Q9HSI7_9FIRM|nr:U32 family peptidase [Anoxybacter fermentans]AZR74258.1 hypothetical protein BBF96_13120 [Anoxybacter fermentans]
MYIQTPLNSAEDVEALVRAGANEFYCGVVPIDWKEKYGFEIPLNCRSMYPWANFASIEELAEAVKRSHYFGKKILVTFNENSYTQSQVTYILNLIEKLVDLSVDGVIVSNLPLLLAINEKKYPIKIVLSGEANCTSIAATHFYKDLNVERIVFPRHVLIKEMNQIILANKNLEYEAFLLNEGCFFNGGYCYSIHHVCYSPLCRTCIFKLKKNVNKVDPYLFEKTKIEGVIKYNADAIIKYNNVKITKCGLCSIKLLKYISVKYLKLVGRTAFLEDRIKWVQIIRKAIQMAEQINDFDEYRDACIEEFFGESSAEICDQKFLCYYPDQYSLEHL